MIKLGIIGTSKITDEFLSAVFLAERFELSAIYSRTLEKGTDFAKKYGAIPVYTDMVKMAESGIEAVYIASPNSCHYSQSKLFLEKQINVICEKPITCSLSQYEELKVLADKNHVIYMEAIMSMYCGGYDFLHNALNYIGKIAMARLDFCQRSSRLNNFYKGIPQNIFDMKLGAGTLMDLGVYCVYGAVDLFGLPNKISAHASFFENGCDCAGSSIFLYDDFQAVLTYCKNGQSIAHSEIIGENGTITIESISQYACIRLLVDGEERSYYPMFEKKNIMLGEVNAFADFIKGDALNLYAEKSEICRNVHNCMDTIKKICKMKYLF